MYIISLPDGQEVRVLNTEIVNAIKRGASEETIKKLMRERKIEREQEMQSHAEALREMFYGYKKVKSNKLSDGPRFHSFINDTRN